MFTLIMITCMQNKLGVVCERKELLSNLSSPSSCYDAGEVVMNSPYFKQMMEEKGYIYVAHECKSTKTK